MPHLRAEVLSKNRLLSANTKSTRSEILGAVTRDTVAVANVSVCVCVIGLSRGKFPV